MMDTYRNLQMSVLDEKSEGSDSKTKNDAVISGKTTTKGTDSKNHLMTNADKRFLQ